LENILRSHGIEQSWNVGLGCRSNKVEGEVVSVIKKDVKKNVRISGGCNFCTRPNESGVVNEISSKDEHRKMVVMICDQCMEELKK
jgi:hypothetical protein